jgi:hypothetical protein
MAHYPSFDPNNYGMVYEKEEIRLSEEEIQNLVPVKDMEKTFWLYRNVAALGLVVIIAAGAIVAFIINFVNK